jgi:hypothetical protein
MSANSRTRLVLVLVTTALTAQQPAPVAETDASVWSAEEAGQLYYLRTNFVAFREAPQPVQIGGRAIPGGRYLMAFFVADEDGNAVMAQSIAKDQALFIVAWPRAISPETRRGILMHADGMTLVCEPTADDTSELSADLVLAKGGAGKFRDALRQPGTGGSGHLWQWLHQTGFQASVQVVDDKGKPRIDVVVEVCGDGPGQRNDSSTIRLQRPLPLAQAKTDARGMAVLKGPRCRDTVVQLSMPAQNIIAKRVTVEDTPSGPRFVVPDAALRHALSAQANANESAAIATLKNISSSQAQCQASAVIDANRNGAGEYGFFAELSANTAVRNDDKGGVGQKKIAPPVLSNAFGKINGSRVARSGYWFQIYLPDSKGQPTAEAATGGSAGVAIDSKKAETMWCCYAWPAAPGSGLRAFFVNQSGDVLACDSVAGYCGAAKPPLPNAAFAAGSTGTMDSKVAVNAAGLDGETWLVVN